jgi:hypothetical protein
LVLVRKAGGVAVTQVTHYSVHNQVGVQGREQLGDTIRTRLRVVIVENTQLATT